MCKAPQVPYSSIPKIAPTVEHKITLAYSFRILFGFGTCGASHIPESLREPVHDPGLQDITGECRMTRGVSEQVLLQLVGDGASGCVRVAQKLELLALQA